MIARLDLDFDWEPVEEELRHKRTLEITAHGPQMRFEISARNIRDCHGYADQSLDLICSFEDARKFANHILAQVAAQEKKWAEQHANH